VEVRKAIEAAGFDYDSSEVQFVASFDQEVDTVELAQKIFRIIDALEISGDCTVENRGRDQKTPVTPGGRVVELMRNYPNMLADLSAGSGENAIMRDPEFGYKFLEEFQDKLFFGVDYCTIKNYRELSHFLDEGVENGRISQKAYNKICRENLLALVEG